MRMDIYMRRNSRIMIVRRSKRINNERGRIRRREEEGYIGEYENTKEEEEGALESMKKWKRKKRGHWRV